MCGVFYGLIGALALLDLLVEVQVYGGSVVEDEIVILRILHEISNVAAVRVHLLLVLLLIGHGGSIALAVIAQLALVHLALPVACAAELVDEVDDDLLLAVVVVDFKVLRLLGVVRQRLLIFSNGYRLEIIETYLEEGSCTWPFELYSLSLSS